MLNNWFRSKANNVLCTLEVVVVGTNSSDAL